MTPLARFWITFTTFASAIPLAVGFWRFAKLPAGARLLVGWLSLTLGLDVYMLIARVRGTARTEINHLSLPGFCIVGLLTLAVLSDNRRFRKTLGVVGVLYLVAWSLVSLLTGIHSDYSVYSHPLMNLVFTGAAAGLIVVRLGQIQARPLQDSVILVALGAIVSFAPSAALSPVAAVLSQSHNDWVIRLFFIRSGFLMLGLLLYTLALLWIRPHPSSSGS